ncbi:MAG: tetratricopeptide repeat protein [SAR324 cluster bacterium]|nr:tetratricopeptide repeat protein [SAR324 cluster bacterium]
MLLLAVICFHPQATAKTLWSQGLTEEEHISLLEQVTEDRLYTIAYQIAESYMQDYPEGPFLEKAHYYKARILDDSEAPPDKTLAEYQAFLTKYPESSYTAEIHGRIGSIHIKTGHYDEAISILESTLSQHETGAFRPVWYYRLGQAWFNKAEKNRQEQTENIEEMYHKASENFIKVDPLLLPLEDQPDYHYLKGWSYQYQKNIPAAEINFQAYLKVPQSHERASLVYYQMGINAQVQTQMANAQLFFDTIVSHYQDVKVYPAAVFRAAETRYIQHETLFSSQPGSSVHQETLELFQKYLETGDLTYQAVTYCRLGQLYQVAGDPAQATASYLKYLETGQGDYLGEAYFGLARIEVQINHPSEAIHWLVKAKKLNDARFHAGSATLLSQLYQQTRQVKKKIEYLSEAVNYSWWLPDQRNYFYLELAQTYFGQNQCSDTLRVLSQSPPFENVIRKAYSGYMQGKCLLEAGKTEEGVARLESVFSLLETPEPELRKSVFALLSTVYLKRKDYPLLVSTCEKQLLPFLPDDTERSSYYLYLGKVFIQAEKMAMAHEWLTKTDQGGISDQELEAVYLKSQLYLKNKEDTAAENLLLAAVKRQISESVWSIPILFELGQFYEQRQQWPKALSWFEATTRMQAKPPFEELHKQASERFNGVRNLLVSKEINELIAQKQWAPLSRFIQTELDTSRMEPTPTIIDILASAEREQKNWEGILNAYARLPGKTLSSVTALLNQGTAAMELKQYKKAETFYLQALSQIETQDPATQIYMIKQLGLLYQNQKRHEELVKVYEKLFPSVQSPTVQIQVAYLLGVTWLNSLKDEKKGLEWLEKTDQGGTSDEEMNALLLRVSHFTDSNKSIALLEKALPRNIPEKSQWFQMLHYQLGALYYAQEKWEKSLEYFQKVAKLKPVQGYEQYHKSAVELTTELKSRLKKK